METNYCRRCGAALIHVNGHVYSCTHGHVIFANASPACALWIVNDRNEVLIATRAHEPGRGSLDAPGGFCDGAETFESTLAREMQEELGLTPGDYTKPQYLLSALDTYDYKDETIDVLTSTFWARLQGSPSITPKDDVAKADFTPIEEIDPSAFYFNAVRTSFVQLKTILTKNA